MKIINFIGRMGSGKSHAATLAEKYLKQQQKTTKRIEVSALVGENLPTNATREQKQQLNLGSDWLYSRIKDRIDKATEDLIIISGLREHGILVRLRKDYWIQSIIITSPNWQRRDRLEHTEAKFIQLEEADDRIGVAELIDQEIRESMPIVDNRGTLKEFSSQIVQVLKASIDSE